MISKLPTYAELKADGNAAYKAIADWLRETRTTVDKWRATITAAKNDDGRIDPMEYMEIGLGLVTTIVSVAASAVALSGAVAELVALALAFSSATADERRTWIADTIKTAYRTDFDVDLPLPEPFETWIENAALAMLPAVIAQVEAMFDKGVGVALARVPSAVDGV